MGTTASLSAADLSSLTPMLARYSGKRDPKEAESFVPATPPGTKFFLRFAFDAFTFRADCRQPFPYRITSGLRVTQAHALTRAWLPFRGAQGIFGCVTESGCCPPTARLLGSGQQT